ncbi:mechanosensitive ion channel family protein (plasmid) [Adhaeribacter radiodurans]|uniref:Mechanosensitive ion channel family protein n=2 Tax=Adhaeribacter radiodurans TaxID=2745197 RepID=A0A7L7L1Z1_9BACT|nr:mechanosensitive ion channel family protein [Adhaeribacter radiodurans]
MKLMQVNTNRFTTNLFNVLEQYWEQFIFVLPRLGIAILILLVTFLLASQVKKIVDNRVAPHAQNPLSVLFVSKVAKITIVIIGLLLALQTIGLTGVAGGLLAGAGVSAFIIGFAFKDIGENFLAGFILAFNAPFKVGDAIKVGEYRGHVVSLNMRTTHLKTFDTMDVYIPNATVLKSEVTNMTQDNLIRLDFLVGIDYSDDVDTAEQLIIDTMKEVLEVLPQPEAFVVTEELATNTVNIRAFFWTDTDDYKRGILDVKGQVIKAVKKALLTNGFGLPANIQELKTYQDMPLAVQIKENKPS